MEGPRWTLARMMILVAMFALDFAALRVLQPIFLERYAAYWVGRDTHLTTPCPGLALTALILEVALVRHVSRRGRIRPFLVGFEVFDWTYVVAHTVFYRSIETYIWEIYEYHLPETCVDYYVGRSSLRCAKDAAIRVFPILDSVTHFILSLAFYLMGGLLVRAFCRRYLRGL